MNNNNSNLRILAAIVLSIMFLVPYMYFFSPQNTATAVHNATSANVAPIIQSGTSNINAPITTNQIESIATVTSKDFTIKIDKLGRISAVMLKGKKWEDSKGKPLSLLNSNDIKPLELRFQDSAINNKAFETPYKASSELINLDESDSRELVLTQDLGDVIVKKILHFRTNMQYDIKIELSKPMPYFISNGARPIADSSAYVFKGVIIKKDDDKLEKINDGDWENTLSFNKAKFVASVDRYYTTLFFKEEGLNILTDKDNANNAIPYAAFDNNASFIGYIGPKDYKTLKAISSTLTDVVEYGIITFFAKPLFLLLEYLFSIFKNWGWAIIGLTVIVRIILYPLTYKGMVSMQKLKDLAPKLKEIQTKYKGDAVKLQSHMMELYRTHKVNPMGGCLPLILQIPVFFAIYRVLYNAVELKDAPWLLWITDLSAMDPYYILPILMGASMYLQQHLTPTTFNDPTQEKIFKFLPLIFTIFLVTFPSGLILYWTINNIFSIIQQLIINKMIAKKKLINKT